MPRAVVEYDPEVRQQTGGPGLPPPHDRDFGGGDNQPPYGRGRSRLTRYRIGLFFAVVSVYTLFIALTTVFILRQTPHFDVRTGTMVRDWVALTVPSILWLNTVVLIISSGTLEVARKRVFSESLMWEEVLGLGKATRKQSLPWLTLSIALGFTFLAGQLLAWLQLSTQGAFETSNPASSFFVVLTATHAVHLLGGLLALCWSAAMGSRITLQSRQISVDISAWYWHAMGALWIYVFALLHWVK